MESSECPCLLMNLVFCFLSAHDSGDFKNFAISLISLRYNTEKFATDSNLWSGIIYKRLHQKLAQPLVYDMDLCLFGYPLKPFHHGEHHGHGEEAEAGEYRPAFPLIWERIEHCHA